MGSLESDTTERLHLHFSLSCIGEGNGNPLQCSCLENPRDGGACWAAVYGVAQCWTRLKRLSSSSSNTVTHYSIIIIVTLYLLQHPWSGSWALQKFQISATGWPFKQKAKGKRFGKILMAVKLGTWIKETRFRCPNTLGYQGPLIHVKSYFRMWTSSESWAGPSNPSQHTDAGWQWDNWDELLGGST